MSVLIVLVFMHMFCGLILSACTTRDAHIACHLSVHMSICSLISLLMLYTNQINAEIFTPCMYYVPRFLEICAY